MNPEPPNRDGQASPLPRGFASSGAARNRPGGRKGSRRRGLPWTWILLGLVLAGGAAAYFGARPAWRMIKAQRAQGFVKKAELAMATQKWEDAFNHTRAALQLAPNNTEVIRLAAHLYGSFGVESAFPFFDTLLSRPEATPQDKEAYAALAFRVGNIELAHNQVEELLENTKPSPGVLVLGAQLAAIRRDLTNAVRLGRAAVAAEPTNPTNVLNLAGLLIMTGSPAERTEARSILWPFARTNGPYQVRALGSILGASDASRAEREEVERTLTGKNPRSLEEEMLLYEARVSLDPSQLTKTADEIVERYGRGSQEELIAAATWLNRRSLFGRTRDLLLPDIARKHAGLFRLRFDAMAGTGDLRGAYEFSLGQGIPGDPFQVELLRCTTALRLKDKVATEAHFNNLLNLAKAQPRRLRTLAEYAFRNGNRKIANEAYQTLAKSPRDAIPATRGIVRVADSLGETWIARDYARKLAALAKDDDNVRVQITYYDLLLNENLAESLASAQRLHQAKPEDFSRRAILALAYLRHNQPKPALELVEGQIVNWNQLVPGVRAVVAASLGAAGRTELASNYVARLPLARLKAEERELVRPYVAPGALPPPSSTAPAAEARP